jgi:DNA-binding NtrC family response regulator
MTEKISVVLVHNRREPLERLKPIVASQSIEARSVRTCGEALLLLWGKNPPQLVFTDMRLPDGTWADVVALAQKCQTAVNVIVVSQTENVKLYTEAMERGAFDFVIPPFQLTELAHVIRCAAEDVQRRRNPGPPDRRPAPLAPKLYRAVGGFEHVTEICLSVCLYLKERGEHHMLLDRMSNATWTRESSKISQRPIPITIRST